MKSPLDHLDQAQGSLGSAILKLEDIRKRWIAGDFRENEKMGLLLHADIATALQSATAALWSNRP